MPTYTYKFLDNGEKREVDQGINDPKLTEIDGREVVRIITSTSFALKGKGFYKTDYGSGKCKTN